MAGLQPVSAPHSCRGKRQCRERRRPSCVTPAVAFLNLLFTGSSTTQRSPLKVQWGPWRHRSQTPNSTTSQASWRSTFPKSPMCHASYRTSSWTKPWCPPAVSDWWPLIQFLGLQHSSKSTNLWFLWWSDGAKGSPMVSRASQAMWIFSTALCVVVGVMVLAGVAYQIHLDRISKRKKEEYNHQHLNRGRPVLLVTDHF